MKKPSKTKKKKVNSKKGYWGIQDSWDTWDKLMIPFERASKSPFRPSTYECKICGKKTKEYGTCSKACLKLLQIKQAKEKAEAEIKEIKRRSQPATIGDIEDAISKAISGMSSCDCC